MAALPISELHARGFKVIPVLSRTFWSHVTIREDGCWQWSGPTCGLPGYNYGQIHLSRVNGKKRRITAHRYAYWRVRGGIPRGLEADHTCRNKMCVNPWHIELVTHAENIRRMVEAVYPKQEVSA